MCNIQNTVFYYILINFNKIKVGSRHIMRPGSYPTTTTYTIQVSKQNMRRIFLYSYLHEGVGSKIGQIFAQSQNRALLQ